MGLIRTVLEGLFGNGRNVIAETAGVFRENAEGSAQREAQAKEHALAQYAAEFASAPRASLFDRVIDGLNRLPRPLLAFGTIGLFITAMVDPIWFASRMQGIALVPEPLWWLMGAIVSFYFGSRFQAKSQDFQRSVTETMTMAGEVTRNIRALEALGAGAALVAQDVGAATATEANPALADWQANPNG